MANTRRSHAARSYLFIDSRGRRAKAAAFLLAGIASVTTIAATSCGAEEPTDRPPTSASRQIAEGGLDTTNRNDVDCPGTQFYCAGRGARCGGGVDCCPGTTCVAMADGYFRCAVPCSFDGDCPKGCCAPASPDGDLVCAAEPCCRAGAIPCSS